MENGAVYSIQPLDADEVNKIEEFRKSKKTAVLAILFSDIVNSTLAAEKLGEQAYSKLRHIHDELFIRIMTRDDAGIIIKEIGDSFLCVFAEPSTAVQRAVEFQRAIHSNKKNLTINNYTLTIKIGVHLGQVAFEDSLAPDIFGRHVNRTARIMSLANGGQILTSRSIWENAHGWFKDHDEQNISPVFYGKTKLKGIDERVEIFGFYAREFGKPAVPNIFRRQNRKRSIIFVSLLLLLSFVLITVNKFYKNSNNTSERSAKNTYYIQFNFSHLQKPVVDTIALAESMLAQVINICYPDSIVTESDLKEFYNRNGRLYTRFSRDDWKYFKDNLHTTGLIFIEADTCEKTDSLLLNIEINNFTTDAIFSAKVSINNVAADFRKEFQEELISLKTRSAIGDILDYRDSTVLFHLNKNAGLRKGALITINRQYPGREGMEHWMQDLNGEIDFYQTKRRDPGKLKEALDRLSFIKQLLSDSSIKINHWVSSAEISGKGKVIEVYDSTAIAVFKRNGIVPWDKPEKGDMVWLSY